MANVTTCNALSPLEESSIPLLHKKFLASFRNFHLRVYSSELYIMRTRIAGW